jgi:hypothetical protein
MPARPGEPNGRCTVCSHAEHTRIDLLLAGGASQRSLARKYGLSHYAIGRHWAGHVSDERKANLVLGPVQRQELASRLSEESASVMDHLRAVRSGLYQLYNVTLEAGDASTGALVAGRLHENLRDIARLTGQLASSPLVQINNTQQTANYFLADPAFAAFQARLIAALRPFPEARGAIIAEFERIESPAPVAIATPLLTPEPEAVDAVP